ncbi:MAG TPA: hypothetical protein VKY85_10025 [Candidatus Angelobacter sp.]|jgi:hypothetical protein|nr:hypothetical protein [Candidatus Angelobacter sp.]
MRIHHDASFAYDLERPRDPQTQLALNWRFAVYRLRPVEEIVARGEAETRAEAEKKAKSTIGRLLGKERKIAA